MPEKDNVTRLYYIHNMRFPTEKAHGYQIAKMCEAFADLGLEVKLLVPKRINHITESVSVYYKTRQNFTTQYLPFLDFLGKNWLPRGMAFAQNGIEFILRCLFLKIPRDAVVYTRAPELAWLFSRRGFKTIFECHQLPNEKSWLFGFLIRSVSSIVAITQGLKTDIMDHYGYPADKISVAPDGVDLETFDISLTREQARQKISLPQDEKIVLYTGHLYAWKGVDTLAQAAALLPPDIRVFMVGGPESEINDMKQRQQISDNVVLLTPRPREEIAIWLKAADLLVLPNSAKENISEKYTSPLKLFEYMASGTPIVASDLPSIREILNQTMASFCTADDPRSLAQTIQGSLQDKVEAGRRAVDAKQAAAGYTWLARAEKIVTAITKRP